MSSQIICPTCGMSASSSDHRQLAPVPVERTQIDLRRCRNCGDLVSLHPDRPILLDHLT